MSARRFVIIEPLGRGGFGTIYKAQYYGDGDFRKYVALKLLNQEVSGIPEVVARLRDEARVLGLLRHRAIVNVDRLSQFNDRWAVIMEYVEGVDLAHLVAQGPVPASAALEIVAEVAGALHAAWTTRHPDGYPIQLLHRDIKPANIQLTAHGEVKVLDFGIARAVFSNRETDTRTGVPGTILYMAPERMELVEGPGADVYSMGSVLFEMLTGERLGRTSPRRERHDAVLRSAEERLLAARLSANLVDFVLTMLAYEPEDRPTAEQCVEIATLLRASTRGEPLRTWAARTVPPLVANRPAQPPDELAGKTLQEQTTTAPPPMVSPAPSAPTLEQDAEPAVEDPPAERSFPWTALILALMIAALGGVTVGLLRSRSEEAPATSPSPAPPPETPETVVAPPSETPDPAPQPELAENPAEPAPKPSPSSRPSTTRKETRPTTRQDGTALATPALTPIPLDITVNGLPSTSVKLVSQSSGESIPASQGWVHAGSYTAKLECPPYGIVSAGTFVVKAGSTSATLKCETSDCRCK